MPIYDYGCKACDHEFQREQRISDKPVKKCPACGKMQARRLISRTSFVLKGGGWYNDLYSSGKPDAGSKDDAAAGSKSETSAESGSEAKPDAKPAAKPETKSGAKTASKKSGGGGGKKDAA